MGYAYWLDDEDYHLAKKHKEEQEEAEGAVSPEKKRKKPSIKLSDLENTFISGVQLYECKWHVQVQIFTMATL